jgi:DNA ligase (NAD+)
MSDIFDALEMDDSKSSEIESLVSVMKQAKENYYNSTPEMTDAEYDVLECKLRELDPSNSLLTDVGIAAPQQGTWPKMAHNIPMGSLDKIMPNDSIEGSKVAPGVLSWWEKTEQQLKA